MRIFEEMSENANPEFLLDQFSEAETDAEFGLPEFKEHFADTLTPAVLKEWTAKDFASIYVRFRPHLESHAKRFLTSPTQIEDVVQDAFLYLMTTLPELDSELGVLKFLKWKVRLLAIDTIRANSKAPMALLAENQDSTASEEAVSGAIERAEDSAIVSLALAKLPPRQRAALIMTIYEELPQSQAAQKLGLSENAFRQLLLRSRRAFKIALVGQAEIEGLTVAQILSIAAKKASALRFGVIASVLLIAVSIFPSQGEVPPWNSSASKIEATPDRSLNFSVGREPRISDEVDKVPTAQGVTTSDQPLISAEAVAQTQDRLGASGLSAPTNLGERPAQADAEITTQDEDEISRQLLQSALGSDKVSSLTSQLDASPAARAFLDERTVRIEYPALKANVILGEQTEEPVQFAYLTFMTAGAELTAVPKTIVSAIDHGLESGSYLEVGMTDFIIGDTSGHFDMVTVADSALSRAYVKLRVQIDSQGELEFPTLQIIQPTGKNS